jgi:hypothetical protein
VKPSSSNRSSSDALGLLCRQLGLLLEREEDLIALDADFNYLMIGGNGTSQSTLTERLGGLFGGEVVAAAEGPTARLVAVVLLEQPQHLAVAPRALFEEPPYLILGQRGS